MEYDKNICPVVDVDGVIATGKQFDLDITLPKDNRNVIYGIIRDCYKEPVRDAVVKLIEVVCECGKEERRPVSHTFTDKNGEFVFGPLCPDKFYEIQIWVDHVKHAKICATCEHEGACLKGVDMDCDKKDKCFHKEKHECKDKCDCKDKHDCKDKCECKNEHDCKDKCDCKKEHECKHCCKPECDCKDKCECKEEKEDCMDKCDCKEEKKGCMDKCDHKGKCEQRPFYYR
ncbi:MAG: hypothetical protein HFJ20_01540 [Clostridia bacterium]|nr:hypothetical protein [Clostridia bacterium]